MNHATRVACALLVSMLGACGNDAPLSRPSSTNTDSEVQRLFAAGEEWYWKSDFDSATSIWSAALTKARADRDPRMEANLLTWLGLAAWRVGEYGEARRLGEAALAQKLELQMDDELSRSHNALAILALSEDRFTAALEHGAAAVAAAREVNDAEALARASSNVGLAYAYLGEFERARAEFQRTEQAAAETGDLRVRANALANIAMVDIWAGDPHAAIAALDTARRFYRQIDYSPGEQNALGQLATAYELLGDYGSATLLLDSALASARVGQMREQEMETLRLLGGIHDKVGDTPRALRYFQQAARIGQEVGLPAELGNVLRNEASARLSMKQFERARSLADSARRLHREAEQPSDELDDVLLGIQVATALRDSSTVRLLATADSLAERLAVRPARVAVSLARARYTVSAREPHRALPVIQTALAQINVGEFLYQAEANALSAQAYEQLGAHDSAAAAGFRAVTALERVRSHLNEPFRATYAAARADIYARLVLTLLKLGRTEEAFVVADGARSRALVEGLVQSRALPARSPNAQSMREAEALLRKIDVLLEQLNAVEGKPREERGAESEATQSDLAARIATSRADYEALVLRTAASRNQDDALLGSRRISVAQTQSALASGEALLQYMLTNEGVVLFVITQNTFRSIMLSADVNSVLPRIRVLRDLWGRPGQSWRSALPAADVLFADLIEPALDSGDLAGVKKLIIVPHGVLGQIPFGALRSAKTQRYLAEDYAVSLLPSGGALVALRSGQRERSSGGGAVFAPLPRELPFSRAEARALGRSSAFTKSLVGASATEAALRRALVSSSLVHVATHGIMNADQPMFSRVQLARGKARDASDDGRLEVHEIPELAIRSHLVFLSGCETAAGREWSEDPVKGAAHTTLAQAFLVGGANAVIATLWPVNDERAARLAGLFYRYLRDMPVADALVRAQRDMIRTPGDGNPYYWAAYTVSGDGHSGMAPQKQKHASVY